MLMETSILTEMEQEVYLEPATPGKRFLNFLLDLIGFYTFIFIIGFLLGAVSPSLVQALFGEETNPIYQTFTSYLIYLVYYTVVEGITKGRSLGKLITGTMAVRNDGSSLTWKDALLRSLSRAVPFEAFSALGPLPWHDKWTNTMVVRKSERPQPVLEM